MADTFFNPTPAISPTNDRWSEPTALGDRWAWIQTENEQDTSWHIQNLFDQATAWHIQNAFNKGTSWHIQSAFNKGTSWHIQNPFLQGSSWHIQSAINKGTSWHIQSAFNNGTSWYIQNAFLQATAWHIFEAIVNYLAMFKIKPLTSTYRLLALTSAFNFEKLQSDYTLLADLIDQHGLAYALKTNFNVDPVLPETFDIDEQPQDNRKIQPAPSGEERPYE